jgi:predicted MFS family arabinose efflux permease
MPDRPAYALVWALLVLAWIANYIVRMAFSALLGPIMTEFGLSYTRAAVLATGFFYAYAFMQFPAGLLGDRFGRRRVLALGLVAGGLACMATALAASFTMLLVIRLLTGASQGCLFSNDRAIIAAVTPPGKISLGQGVSFSGPGLGIMLGLLLGGLLGEYLSWRWVFVLFGVPPIIAALLIVRFVPAPPPGNVDASLGRRIKTIGRERRLWILAMPGFTVMWVQFVLITWAPLLYVDAGVKDLGSAGFLSSLLGVAAVLGLVAGGWLGDRARRYDLGPKAVVVAAMVAMSVAMALTGAAVQWRWPTAVLTAGFFAVSFFTWSIWGPSFALLGGLLRGDDVSTAFGLYNGITVLGAIVGPTVTGSVRDATGSFAAGLYVAAVIGLAGTIVATRIRAAEAAPSTSSV